MINGGFQDNLIKSPKKPEVLDLLEKNIQNLMIPPAENLIKKSIVPIEEAKTGAAIAFEKI